MKKLLGLLLIGSALNTGAFAYDVTCTAIDPQQLLDNCAGAVASDFNGSFSASIDWEGGASPSALYSPLRTFLRTTCATVGGTGGTVENPVFFRRNFAAAFEQPDAMYCVVTNSGVCPDLTPMPLNGQCAEEPEEPEEPEANPNLQQLMDDATETIAPMIVGIMAILGVIVSIITVFKAYRVIVKDALYVRMQDNKIDSEDTTGKGF